MATNESLVGIRPDHASEFFTTVLRTVPVQPRYGRMRFGAEGILLPGDREWRRDRGTDERYEKDCNTNRVLPYSCLNMNFNPETNSFIHNGIAVIRFSDPEKDGLIVDAMLEGRKPHLVDIGIGTEDGAVRGYEVFRHKLLNSVLEKGYQPYSGELRFTNDLPEGAISFPGFSFKTSEKDIGMTFSTSNCLPENVGYSLKTWFDNLPRR